MGAAVGEGEVIVFGVNAGRTTGAVLPGSQIQT